MRFRYVLYPSVMTRLDESGLIKRIEEARRKGDIGIIGHVADFDVPNCVKDMKEDNLFDTLNPDERKSMSDSINAAWAKRERGSSWKIELLNSVYEEKVEAKDFLLLCGWNASRLLKGEDLFDYKKFGFSNPVEFVGTVGAAVETKLHRDVFREGYSWETTRPDGRVFVNNITGDINADLRVFQTDVTPYKTTDPLGNVIEYRPETSFDRRFISAYHSTESDMLVTILKWVNQLGLNPESLENNAKKTIEWARSLGQGGGQCAEHFFETNSYPRRSFLKWRYSMPRLDKTGISKDECMDFLATTGNEVYRPYITEDNNLW